MSEASDDRTDDASTAADGDGETRSPPTDREDGPTDDESEPSPADDLEALRREVDEKYDFDDFRPADMAKMTAEEWDVAFDPDTWITGIELLDRVEQDLKSRIATREVFAVLERLSDEEGPRLLAYSDEGYATVYPDGSVEGRGTVLRDVKPTVALCSMEEYTPQEPPERYELPSPEEVTEQSGELGNLMLQIIAAGQILAGLAAIVAWALPGFIDRGNLVVLLLAGVFIAIGLFLFMTVANARLSDRFRSEQYRNRLRAVQLEGGERPEMLPSQEPDSTEGNEPISRD
ncbi:DUF7319 domain-containing protein [Halalkalirubrum salinum]|uniref:DUF7319 domain-containing protein n=1 Tax=Halalkalirubrum salinum TaxID=2563889 RepID=UPI0010FB4B13|nr:hypothetical protein [Halalkalirubrum salinum]